MSRADKKLRERGFTEYKKRLLELSKSNQELSLKVNTLQSLLNRNINEVSGEVVKELQTRIKNLEYINASQDEIIENQRLRLVDMRLKLDDKGVISTLSEQEEDNTTLSGKDAERFLKKMKETEERKPTEEEKQMAKEIKKLKPYDKELYDSMDKDYALQESEESK